MLNEDRGWILYHTDACHLCDLAADLLQQAQVSYSAQDICDNESLAACYGTRIPVIKKKPRALNSIGLLISKHYKNF